MSYVRDVDFASIYQLVADTSRTVRSCNTADKNEPVVHELPSQGWYLIDSYCMVLITRPTVLTIAESNRRCSRNYVSCGPMLEISVREGSVQSVGLIWDRKHKDTLAESMSNKRVKILNITEGLETVVSKYETFHSFVKFDLHPGYRSYTVGFVRSV